MGNLQIKLEDFKEQYSKIMLKRFNYTLEKNLTYLKDGINPYKVGTVEFRINDSKEMITRVKDALNIKFNRMEFFGYTSNTDEMVVKALTNQYSLSELHAFSKKKILEDIRNYRYNKFVFKDDTLIDIISVPANEEADTLLFVVNGIEYDFLKYLDKQSKEYLDIVSKSKNTVSNYVVQHTRSGANLSYWNIGGTRVYD